ncbi:arylsulfatase [Tsukamurella soli]
MTDSVDGVRFQGAIADDIRHSEPDWLPFRAAQAPAGAPNVLYILWDDIGIGTWDCFGGLVEMPTMRRIADLGVRLTQFHTTALCSPTRAALLTGRNATSVGVGSVENLVEGFPGYNGRIPAEKAMLSEVLGERGWATYAVGKWHLAPLEECHAAGSRRHWPIRRGFDRFYGFLDGLTDQWYPSLVSDNHPVDPPASPEQGYHLSRDLADHAVEFLRDSRASAPGKPWLMYLCPGAGHSPHQVAKEWADRYRGRFDMGYEAYREIVLANQKAMGLLPPDTEMSPINPYADATAADGTPWPQTETVLPWDSLTDEQRRVSCRMAEVFAGFLSYTDAQLGRVLDFLEETGQLDNTIIVAMSDNGASGEGGPAGTLDEMALFAGADRSAFTDGLARLDEFGSPGTHINYSNGWGMAFNTPYKLFKRYASHEGGIADPCIIAWPDGIAARGEVREQYVHVSDVTPTVYDLLGVEPPATVGGVPQAPLEGVSFRAALDDAEAATPKSTQFYSMMGTRGIWHEGWFADTVHPPTALHPRGWSNFDQDRWELFHIERDRSQVRDLADRHPEKLRELEELWRSEAEKHQAFPLSDLSLLELMARGASSAAPAPRSAVFYPHAPAHNTRMTGLVRGRSFTLRAQVTVTDDDACGVLFSQGDRSNGQALFAEAGRLHYAYTGPEGGVQAMVSDRPLPRGEHSLGVRFTRTGAAPGEIDSVGDAELLIDDDVVGAYAGMYVRFLDIVQTVSVGRSVSYSVSPDYSSPFPFTGGAIARVDIDFDGDPVVNRAALIRLAFARD